MNLIKQIESALQGIGQARFQDLISHFLHVKGYQFIGAPGSVVAKEKTSKGAPDSFFASGDNFVFVECTTQERLGSSKTFVNKLLKDIAHCFDEGKTKIEPSKTEKIILACTEKIDADDYQQLKNKVNEFNISTQLEVYDIQNLPLNIYDFPGLSEQYLGVAITKGEIYNLPDFLQKTTKGLQPSLMNEFTGREDELKQVTDCFQSVDVVLLSGGAGVGKSKLAVAALEETAKGGFIPIVIQSSAVPLWDDFVNLFQNGKDYIILFDDANKSVQNLTYLLDFVQRPRIGHMKVVVTCRDYVKQQVMNRLRDSRYKEVVVSRLKDKEIREIVLKALPQLHHYDEIRRKIVELAKGNTRVALMATYSVIPGADINYLSSPVKLYEKYFEKISEDAGVFSRPGVLISLAIVSFFGVLDKNNNKVRDLLGSDFGIDWDELWTTILELHALELVDVYANDIVKVSDQVLSTYAFYKCFLDDSTSLIDYGKWISTFIKSHSHRIKNSLIDANNTFGYWDVRNLVLPHLQAVLSGGFDDELLYTFHSLFWFYKGYDTLKYLKSWIAQLPSELTYKPSEFSYVHNNHTTVSKYFELLINFWNHANELLKPSLELALELVEKQPKRLAEFLKFLNDSFTYQREDVENNYTRQIILIDTLLEEKRSPMKEQICNGTFLNISEKLLGWHFNEHRSKGLEFTVYSFDLHRSPSLLQLRGKILEGVYNLFAVGDIQIPKILNQIVHPGGKIDQQIYAEELPFYQKLISEKLSVKQHAHCKFVKTLAKHLTDAGVDYPEGWNLFIHSEVMKLSKFLKIDWEDNRGKTAEERMVEKRIAFKDFVSFKSWENIEYTLHDIDELGKQDINRIMWYLTGALSDIYIAIADKSKDDIIKALELFFSGTVSFSLHTRVLNYILNQRILSSKEIFSIINKKLQFKKPFWIISLLNALPTDQIDNEFTELLIETVKESTESLPIFRMSDFSKFNEAFAAYQQSHPEETLADHNIITYLTELLLAKQDKYLIELGYEFCQDCSIYFTKHLSLFKQAYAYLKKHNNHFDYDGEELEVLLQMDNQFFVEYLEQKMVDFTYLNFKIEDFKLDVIWTFPDYENIIKDSLRVIIEKSPVFSNSEHPSTALFTFKKPSDEILHKVNRFIEEYIREHASEEQPIKMIMNVVLHRFPDWFIGFLKQFLFLNKDVEAFRSIWLDRGGILTNGGTHHIHKDIDFCNEIIAMVRTLPDVLDYTEHLAYLERRIARLRRDILYEQEREFREYYG